MSEIVEAARACGLRVWVRNDELGDLDVQYGKVSEIWEVKVPGGSLTETQIELRKQGWHLPIIETAGDAVIAAKAIRSRA